MLQGNQEAAISISALLITPRDKLPLTGEETPGFSMIWAEHPATLETQYGVKGRGRV